MQTWVGHDPFKRSIEVILGSEWSKHRRSMLKPATIEYLKESVETLVFLLLIEGSIFQMGGIPGVNIRAKQRDGSLRDNHVLSSITAISLATDPLVQKWANSLPATSFNIKGAELTHKGKIPCSCRITLLGAAPSTATSIAHTDRYAERVPLNAIGKGEDWVVADLLKSPSIPAIGCSENPENYRLLALDEDMLKLTPNKIRMMLKMVPKISSEAKESFESRSLPGEATSCQNGKVRMSDRVADTVNQIVANYMTALVLEASSRAQEQGVDVTDTLANVASEMSCRRRQRTSGDGLVSKLGFEPGAGCRAVLHQATQPREPGPAALRATASKATKRKASEALETPQAGLHPKKVPPNVLVRSQPI